MGGGYATPLRGGPPSALAVKGIPSGAQVSDYGQPIAEAPFRMNLRSILLAIYCALALPMISAAEGTGVPISYQLPEERPGDYLVTLAVVDAKNPAWLISTFVAGARREVTAQNGGRFTETWDGLDDNFMPVPPGEYAVKGIHMPAKQWVVDGEWHAITPKFVSAASSWSPPREEWKTPLPFGGDPVGAPLGDIAVGANGVAVFYYRYLENGTNNPTFDLNRPIGHGQFLRAYPSGGAGGGSATATDGETVWSFCDEGGPKYVYRADQKPFGNSQGANRTNGFLPQGWVTSMAAWRDGGRAFVAVAQRGRIVAQQAARHVRYVESEREAVDKITLHDGATGAVVSEVPLPRPRSVTVQAGVLYALHAAGAGFAISGNAVGSGYRKGTMAAGAGGAIDDHAFRYEGGQRWALLLER